MNHKTYQGQTNDLALFFKLEGIKKMNKLNKNEVLQITTVMPTMKKSLLALAVAGTMTMSGLSLATVTEVTGSAADPDTARTTDGFKNDTAAGAHVLYDSNGVAVTVEDGNTVANDTTIFIHDSDTGGDDLIIGTVDITAGETLTVILGQTSSTASVAAADAASVDFGVISGGGNLAINGGTAGVDLTVTQVVDFSGAANAFGDLTITNTTAALTLNSAAMTITDLSTTSMTATNVTITGSSAGTAESGDATGTLTITNATGTVAVSGTYLIQGGTGSVSAANIAEAGGATTLAKHDGAVSGGIYTLRGGIGGSDAAVNGKGGLMTITEHDGAISSTTLNILAGSGGTGIASAGGEGGDIVVTAMAGAITSATTNIRGGAGSAGLANDASGDGGAGGAITTSAISSTIGADGASTVLNIAGGAGGAGGVGLSVVGGDGGDGGAIEGTLTLSGAIFSAVTIDGGAAANGAFSTVGKGGVGGAGGLINNAVFSGTVTGNVIMNGGAGGDGSAGSVEGSAIAGAAGGIGGAISASDFAAVVGNLTLTGGAGGDGGLAGGVGSAAGGAGGAGGLIVVTDMTSLTGDLTVLGGAGGDGGAGFTGSGLGGAGAVGGAVTVTSIDAFAGTAATGGAISITGGKGGNGGADATAAGLVGTAGGLTTVTIHGTSDISTLNVTGGAGGDGALAVAGTAVAGGTAGTAAFTATTAAQTITEINVTGGKGGNGGAAGTTVGGAGIIGATANATIGSSGTGSLVGQTATTATVITVTGGAGGNGGAASTSIAGVAGVNGGASTMTLDTATSKANVTLASGAAGSAGADATGFSGGTAGAGGVATLALAGAQTFTGNILTTGNGTGVLTTAGVTTIDGNVGSSTSLDLASLTTVADLHVNGNLYVAAITLGDELTLTGTTDQVVSGTVTAVDTSADDDLIISAEARSVTFNGAVSVADITLGAGSTTTFDSTADAVVVALNGTTTFTGAATFTGATSMAAGTTTTFASTASFAGVTGTTTANMTFDGAVTATGDIATGVGSTTVFNSTVNAATSTLNGSTTFEDAVTLTGVLTTGTDSTITLGSKFKGDSVTAITVANSTAAGLNQAANTVTVNLSNQFTAGSFVFLQNGATAMDSDDLAAFKVTDTAIVDYTAALSTSATAIEITANKRTTAGIATHLGMSTAQAAALGQITAAVSGDATASTALDTVLLAGGSTAVNAAEQLNSDAGAAMGAAMAVTGGVNNVIAGRQANTKIAFNTLGKQSGVSTGDASNDAVVWAQVFTSDATQDKVNNIDGYDADSQGLVVGWEAEKAGSTFGLSLSFADTDVDGKSAAAAHIDTSSVQGTIYGSNGSADWMMGYASADNDTTRTINFGGLTTRTATGNYASNILMAKAGYSFDSIEMAGGVATLTPKADLSWTHINNDGYTETGASNLNLIVDSTSNDVVTARAGMEFAQRIENNGSVTIPRVSIMGGYDLNNDRAETTSTFTGGGSSFTTQGIDPSNASLELGVGVDHVSDDSTVSFNFNTNLKDGYNSDTASLTYKSKF